MPRTAIDDAANLAVADVLHKRFTALPASATVGEVRAWFQASSHRQMAVLADRGCYVGSLTRTDVAGELDPERPASKLARRGPTVAPDAPARTGHELALSTEALRVPVVDREGPSARRRRRDRRSGRLLRNLLDGRRRAGAQRSHALGYGPRRRGTRTR